MDGGGGTYRGLVGVCGRRDGSKGGEREESVVTCDYLTGSLEFSLSLDFRSLS